MARERSAKPLFTGSSPVAASKEIKGGRAKAFAPFPCEVVADTSWQVSEGVRFGPCHALFPACCRTHPPGHAAFSQYFLKIT